MRFAALVLTLSCVLALLLLLLLLQVPAEYPLRPSLVSLAENGNVAVQEELRTISNEVMLYI